MPMLKPMATKPQKMFQQTKNLLKLYKSRIQDMSSNHKNYYILLLALFGFSVIGNAQEKETIGSETVVVVKPYTPSVSDAFKVKAKPVLNDSVNLAKKAVSYKIFSVPVASTFTPAKGTAAKVEKAKPIKAFDNYVTLGAGNYTSALAEFYTNFEIDRGRNFGINLKHNSAQGGIDGVVLDDKYYDTNLNLDYSVRERDLNYTIGANIVHKLYNWYGLPESLDNATILRTDAVQNYLGGGLVGRLHFEDAVLDKASARLDYFSDAHGSSEIRGVLKPQFGFEIAGEEVRTAVVVDYLNGSFEKNLEDTSALNYSFLNLGLSPSILILRDDLELNLGATVYYSMDSENSDSSVFVYPNIEASYRVAGEYFIAYAGLKGDLKQNNYKDIVNENPFVSPTLTIAPTDNQYKATLGIKGKLSEVVSYNLNGNYANSENQLLFKSNPNRFAIGGDFEDYEYGNSFGVVYDNISTVSFFGELNFDVSKRLRLTANAEYFSYDTEFNEEAWNLPEFKASILGDVKITEKLTAGANIFFVGERFDELGTLDSFGNLSSQVVSLDAYVDANLKLSYDFNPQLSFFVRGNNLLSDNYEKWVNFPVYGIQGLAGATYKFDW